MKMKAASGIFEIKRPGRDIEKKTECPWSQFGSRIKSIETDLQVITRKLDALAGKIDRILDSKECPFGFDYLPEIDQCLKLNTEVMPWTQAHATCRRMAKGGQLVTITDSAKQDAVKRYLEKQFAKQETAVCVLPVYTHYKQSAWINGQRKIPNQCNTPFVWKYKHGIELPFAFTYWGSGEPNCHENNEHCAHITTLLDYRWNDVPCAFSLCSVCEI